MANNPTRFGTIATGAISGAIVSAAAVGSLLLAGNTVTDPARNSAPSMIFGTASYSTFIPSTFTSSGANFRVARVLNPFVGPAIVHRIQEECASTFRSFATDAGIRTSAQLNSSGSDVWNSRVSGTGSVKIVSTGSFILLAGGAVRVTSQSDTYAQMPRCQLKVWMSERYVP